MGPLAWSFRVWGSGSKVEVSRFLVFRVEGFYTLHLLALLWWLTIYIHIYKAYKVYIAVRDS